MQRIIYLVFSLLLPLSTFSAPESFSSQAEKIQRLALFQKTPLSETLIKEWNNQTTRKKVIDDYLSFYEKFIRSVFSESGFTVPMPLRALQELAPVYLLYFKTMSIKKQAESKDLQVISYLLTKQDQLAAELVRSELAIHPSNLTFRLLAAGIGIVSDEKFFTAEWDSMLKTHRKQALCTYLFFHAIYTYELKDIRIAESEIFKNLRNAPSILDEMSPSQIQAWMTHLIKYYMKSDSSPDLSFFRNNIEKDSLYFTLAKGIPGYAVNIGRDSRSEYILFYKLKPQESVKKFVLNIKRNPIVYHDNVSSGNNIGN